MVQNKTRRQRVAALRLALAKRACPLRIESQVSLYRNMPAP
jgi:hypothetical protein